MPVTRPRHRHAPPARSGTNYVTTWTKFLDLPIEIRLMIYRSALIALPTFMDSETDLDNIEVPMEPNQWPSGRQPRLGATIWQTHQPVQRPCTMLLATCKKAHREAVPILYGENIFRLPAAAKLSEEGCWDTHASDFRNVVISVSRQSLLYGDPRPDVTADFERAMDEDDKLIMARLWKCDVVKFRYFKTGCLEFVVEA